MPKLSPRCYSDREIEEPEYRFCQCMEKGKAAFCGVAYPTEGSRSALAVGKLLEISSGSFLRRPALMDEAMETIASFMNEGLYAMQEPDKVFLASVAILYLWQGNARALVSGNARIVHYRNGAFQQVLLPDKEQPLFGVTLRRREHPGPVIGLGDAGNQFLLLTASEGYELDALLTEERLSAPMAEQDNAKGAGGVSPDWVEGIFESFQGQPCSIAFLDLPERKRGLFR